MDLSNSFIIEASPEDVWRTVGDMHAVAQCLPGAEILEEDGDTYRGQVTVKAGPITMRLGGTAEVLSRDTENHRLEARIAAEDLTGQGSAQATMVASASPVERGTEVRIRTDLQLGGKIAQFGSGLISHVSGRIVKQVATRMQNLILTGSVDGKTSTTVRSGGAVPADSQRPLLTAGTWVAVDIALVGLSAVVLGWSLGRTLRRRPC